MKKKITLVIVTILLTMTTNINAMNPNVHFGAKAGFIQSHLNNDDGDDTDPGYSVFAGVFATIGMSESWLFQPEVLIAPQNCSDSEGKGEFTYSYLQIPMLFNYSFSSKWSVEFGPQVNLLLSANYENSEFDVDEDISDAITNVDYAFDLGVNYKINDKVFLNARYIGGLSDINDNNTDATITKTAYTLSVGYIF